MNHRLCTCAHRTNTRADGQTDAHSAACKHTLHTCHNKELLASRQRNVQADHTSDALSLDGALRCIISSREDHLHHKAILLLLTREDYRCPGKQKHTHNQRARQVVTYLHLRQAGSCWLKEGKEEIWVERKCLKHNDLKLPNLWVLKTECMKLREDDSVWISCYIWYLSFLTAFNLHKTTNVERKIVNRSIKMDNILAKALKKIPNVPSYKLLCERFSLFCIFTIRCLSKSVDWHKKHFLVLSSHDDHFLRHF